jgi:DNA-binding NarL/FixJ family response regulator
MRKVTIACVDDHQLFIKAVSTALSPIDGIKILFTASNGRELLTFLEASVFPDIILLDIQMPILDGFETLSIVNEKYPDIKVVMLTMHSDSSIIKKCKELGAAGFLTKNTTALGIISAMEDVMDGNFHFPDLLRKDYLL